MTTAVVFVLSLARDDVLIITSLRMERITVTSPSAIPVSTPTEFSLFLRSKIPHPISHHNALSVAPDGAEPNAALGRRVLGVAEAGATESGAAARSSCSRETRSPSAT